MWCKICGGEIYPGIESVGGSHADMDHCVVILNARVEYLSVRVAELEARLAEQEWRPVTEPPESGVWRGFLYDPDVHYMGGDYAIYSLEPGTWIHNHPITPTHWRPLPPPPAATDEDTPYQNC